jgi:hypothetical protein
VTVAAATPLTNITAIAGQTDFPFTWRADSAGVVKVYIDDVLQGGPVIVLNPDQVASPGGTATLPAQTAGKIISIERALVTDQTVDVAAYGPFSATLVEDVLDRVIMRVQELSALFQRTFRVKRSVLPKISSFEFPPPLLGYVPGWVAAGGGLFKLDNVAQAPAGPPGADGAAGAVLTYLFRWDRVANLTPQVGTWAQVAEAAINTPSQVQSGVTDNHVEISQLGSDVTWAKTNLRQTTNALGQTDYTVRAVIRNPATSGQALRYVLGARLDATAQNGYFFALLGDGASFAQVQLLKRTAGAFAALHTLVPAPNINTVFPNWDSNISPLNIELMVKGSWVTLRINGKVIYQVRDTAHTTGAAAIGTLPAQNGAQANCKFDTFDVVSDTRDFYAG